MYNTYIYSEHEYLKSVFNIQLVSLQMGTPTHTYIPAYCGSMDLGGTSIKMLYRYKVNMQEICKIINLTNV